MKQKGNKCYKSSTYYYVMAVPNKSEWSVAFDYIFAELSEKELPLSSFSFFKAINPLKFKSKGEALFQCPKCSRHWSSINGIINFDYRLSINSDTELVMEMSSYGLLDRNARSVPNVHLFLPNSLTMLSIMLYANCF